MLVLSFGAGRGIRTPVGFHPNGFQDRLVMTASIFLHKSIYPSGLPLAFLTRYIILLKKENVNRFYQQLSFAVELTATTKEKI